MFPLTSLTARSKRDRQVDRQVVHWDTEPAQHRSPLENVGHQRDRPDGQVDRRTLEHQEQHPALRLACLVPAAAENWLVTDVHVRKVTVEFKEFCTFKMSERETKTQMEHSERFTAEK